MRGLQEQLDWERQRAAYIHAFIRTKQALLKSKVEGVHADERELKETFWNDVTVNFSTADDTAETISSIKQQAELLNERERSAALIKKQMKTLRRLAESPYFGRIDVKEDGQSEIEAVYIGIASLMDEQEFDFLIYDWRAPICSLYYDSEPGQVSYTAPAGEVHGELLQKRQYLFHRGELEAMFDTTIAIGDDRLRAALAAGASTQMKTIISTIQKEQNEAIRDEKSAALIVQGVAGSGKTSVAMQRAAYLLYRQRKHLDASQLILFSPNRLFSSYVSTVLPELGEENMTQKTFGSYVYERLGKVYDVEDGFSQLEYALGAQHDKAYAMRMMSMRYKASARYKQRMDDYIALLHVSGLPFCDLLFRKEVLISKEEMKHFFDQLNKKIPLTNRVHLLAEWLLKLIIQKEKREHLNDWVEAERELLDEETLFYMHRELQKQYSNEDVFNENEAVDHVAARHLVKKAFQPLRNWVKSFQFIHMPLLYSHFLRSDVHRDITDFAMIADWTESELAEKRIPFEDTTPFLYLQDAVQGFRVDRTVKHVFIDEAQDYASFQFAYLRMMYPKANFTIVGDSSQALFPHVEVGEGFQALSSWAGSKQLSFHKSYRATKPLMSFARELLPHPEVIEPFERVGETPLLIVASNSDAHMKAVRTQIEAFSTQGIKTVAVVTKTVAEAVRAHAQLSEWHDIQLVARDDQTYQNGAVVLPVYLAKGLEFDAVLVFDASKEMYVSEYERYHLYTACTRAMNQLFIFATVAPCHWIAKVPSHLYRRKEATTPPLD